MEPIHKPKDTTEKAPDKKRNIKVVTFLMRHERYNRGETAGFPPSKAAEYIKLKVAAEPDAAKKILAADEK